MASLNNKTKRISMKKHKAHILIRRKGAVLGMVVLCSFILTVLGVGILASANSVRHQAVRIKSETDAMLAAEVGYENAIFWMSKQEDMLYTLKSGGNHSDSVTLPNGSCEYTISFNGFIRTKPTYRIESIGKSGKFKWMVNVVVMQAISGWDIGMCRVPSSQSETVPVYFANGEIIDMPIHVNKLSDRPDESDIYLTGSPRFLSPVSVSESRYTSSDYDKYGGLMNSFEAGICFDQPNSKITDQDTLATKFERFKQSTVSSFNFTPSGNAPVTRAQPAVQLEFFVEGGVGKVRITEDCTVRGFMQNADRKTWDFKIADEPDTYERYPIYAYHLIDENAEVNGKRYVRNIEESYTNQSIGSIVSESGGQIFVDGNVVIGGDLNSHSGMQILKGRLTVAATGNIWIADSLMVDGARDEDGMPASENTNAIGLMSMGVIKVVDPGMADYRYVDDYPSEPAGYKYEPIGLVDSGMPAGSYERHLPDPLIVEASVTVGGGGWGAENVQRRSSWYYYGGRKEYSGRQDNLILRGSITEAVRGVVGLIGSDGYLKKYYFDPRMREGIIPGDVWLQSKFLPTPAGWHDYRYID